jgi:RNA polymerase sigma-70 factor (ECF subfamily)
VPGAEAELVDQLRNGDESAFAGLVDRYHTRLVRFAVTFVHDWSAAEDVAQDTWIAVLRGIDNYERRSSLQTWLFGICANQARSAYARQVRVVPIEPNEPAVDPARFDSSHAWALPPDPWGEVDARLDADAIRPLVRAAIDDLPATQRQVVTLRDIEGLTSKEVCMVLEISEANQRVLLHRARSRVRSALEVKLSEPRP